PGGVYPEIGARIMDLQDPTGKMGKTGSTDQGTIRLVDPPESGRRKLKSAVTDSGREIRHDPVEKVGISNLIEIMTVATGESIAEVEKRYEGGAGYGQFKSDVGDAVVELLEPIQARFRALRDDPAELERMLARGAAKAREAAAPTLEKMYDRMGFTQPRECD
ncbi:MAG: tryptophan--tRNA ligase, partial [Gaiellaceae bacterium]